MQLNEGADFDTNVSNRWWRLKENQIHQWFEYTHGNVFIIFYEKARLNNIMNLSNWKNGRHNWKNTLFDSSLLFFLISLLRYKLKPEYTPKERACINYLTYHTLKKRIEAICGDEELCVDVMWRIEIISLCQIKELGTIEIIWPCMCCSVLLLLLSSPRLHWRIHATLKKKRITES